MVDEKRNRGPDLKPEGEIGYAFINANNRLIETKFSIYSPDYNLLDVVKTKLMLEAIDDYKITNARWRKPHQRDTWEITLPICHFETVKEVLKPWLRVYNDENKEKSMAE